MKALMSGSVAAAALVAIIAGCGLLGEGDGAPCEANMGYPRGTMPDIDIVVGQSIKTPLLGHFSRPECMERRGDSIWLLQSSDSAVVAVSVSDHVLTTAGLGVGHSIVVRVGPDWSLFADPLENYAHEFLVRVRPHPAER